MSKPFLIPFPGPEESRTKRVGGKAASLLLMSAAGLPVPPGIVLTTKFFKAWFEAVKAMETWTQLTEARQVEWSPLCSELKRQARVLPLTAKQRDALQSAQRDLLALGDDIRLAVRSSSPDEDLAAASFAGGYETRLGVRPTGLEDAVRACFASSLDVRVLAYKQAHGFDLWLPRIAVIVQQQVDSEVSGVAFSLNPVTNDYDEAVVDANWGLGTSVVDGRVTPDHFVVDKTDGRVIEATVGGKHASFWLDADHGTVERANETPDERTLTDARLAQLTEMIARIETLFETPVDVEWAYARDMLYVLQARPITAYVPLPPEMMTAPGQPRFLYADAALSKGLTTNAPISPLGIDNMRCLFSGILRSSAGVELGDAAPHEAMVFFAGGRMYMNYSNILWLASSRALAKSAAPTDALMAEILGGVDPTTYRSAEKPAWAGVRMIGRVPRILWNLRGVLGNVLRDVVSPDKGYKAYRHTIDAVASDLRSQIEGGLSLDDFRREYEPRMASELFEDMMPALLVGLISPEFTVLGTDEETKALAGKLTLGAAGNVVVEMGIAMYGLARRLDPSEFADLDVLAERIRMRRMPDDFLAAWDAFLGRYGWRGPQEMDPASPRYADDPRLALRQMSYMAGSPDDEPDAFDPDAAHRRLANERAEAYEVLLQRLDPVRRALLRWIYRRIDQFAGTRDTPKHLIVLYNYVVRQRALALGRRFVADGRLDAPEDVFAFNFDDLRVAENDETLDLRGLRDARMPFYEKLEAHVTNFPPVIDSRGRILRPVRKEADDSPGVMSGMPVSSGVVTGPARILHSADEKPVEKGDVLVAYTTDPGWTPLFVNAAAIVLEVGGVLQHGAVVAREYGKPCVVGIDRVTTRLQDGDLVEVDGSSGTVRMLVGDFSRSAPRCKTRCRPTSTGTLPILRTSACSKSLGRGPICFVPDRGMRWKEHRCTFFSQPHSSCFPPATTRSRAQSGSTSRLPSTAS